MSKSPPEMDVKGRRMCSNIATANQKYNDETLENIWYLAWIQRKCRIKSFAKKWRPLIAYMNELTDNKIKEKTYAD